MKLKRKYMDIIREVANKKHCPYQDNVCYHCPLRIFDNEENSCSDNARIFLELLKVDNINK